MRTIRIEGWGRSIRKTVPHKGAYLTHFSYALGRFSASESNESSLLLVVVLDNGRRPIFTSGLLAGVITEEKIMVYEGEEDYTGQDVSST